MNSCNSRPKNRVVLIQDDYISLSNVTADMTNWLLELGAKEQLIEREHFWIIPITSKSDIDVGNALTMLRDRGFLFMGAPSGWPPAEIFREMRQKGLVNGKFSEVLHYGAGKWRTYSR